ncbi:HK97 family phage prohead protease [Paenarthrobacter nicotinovorans]|uniref:HK97 family phage prohead protease n=1 Tax=Paenarthrobacter nicotinovorans TaxID=29320 RepID=UPI0007CC8E66|nr:HK97 family phage prohead protease [Paenarthrobacter nicotinovorans]GAT87968.1 HK97 family phage prohead protease [Paenarthrobacter nicotinovorans]
MDPLKITLAAATTTDTATRTISGTITMFNTTTSSRSLKLMPGCLNPREPFKRVKLLVDHNMSNPVGYMAEFTQGPDKADAAFHIPEGEEGDKALADADKGLRDGMSVGLFINEYTFDTDDNLLVHQAELYEVSLVSIPDFQDAQVETVALAAARNKGKSMTPEEIARLQAEADAANAAVATANAQLGAATPPPAEGVTPPAGGNPAERVAHAPGLQAGGFPQAGSVTTNPRPVSLAMAAQTVSAAIATGDALQIRLALADVLPSDDGGEGYLSDRGGWIGEVWRAENTERPWVDAFGTPAQLTSMKIKGFRWETRPKPAKYNGNKEDVPTNKPKTIPWESEAGRWAGGWDIDRIFFDLGDASFLESFWRAAMAEYKADSNAEIGKQVLAAATQKAAAPSVLAGISWTARDLRSIGAKASSIFLAEDIFDEYSDLKQSEVPVWLANVIGGVNIADGTADVGPLKIESNPDLAAGQIVGLDGRAGQVREKTPIKIQAQDIAKGGIDLGFFSYGGLAVYDPRAIVKRQVTPAAPGA